jgi:serine/threonine protein kinase/tetratricopeptide (TPR) repeat protein
MPFVIGENIGPYRLVDQLGQGGMATVFKAYHPALDRYVAIKALHPALTGEANFLTRFQREAQVVARLEHPNIVPIYDYSEHEGRPYLVMKFIEGETLKARLKRGALDNTELANVVDSVGAALSYAHAQGVLHRDVKPSNVLLATDGRIYLADFGLARMAEAGESTISSDVMLGTPQYISPEQASGRRDLDNGTDIYSFGILLYELLVGKVPYNADTPYSIIHDHIYAPLPLPRSIKPEIPEAVERVLLRALAKDRQDRFPDVAALLEAWHQAILEPAQAQAPSPVAVEAPVAPAVEQVGEISVEQTRLAEPHLSESPDAPLAGSQESPQAAPAKGSGGNIARRKGLSFWMAAGIVLLIVCLCAAAYILSSGARKKVRQATVTAQALAGAAVFTPAPLLVETTYPQPYVYPLASAVASSLPTLRPPKPIWSALQATGTLSQTGQIDAALAGVQQAPQSASAYLDLAIAYGVQGMPDEAQKAFKTAVGLAAVPADFYELAGDRISEREAWSLAAAMYLEALNQVPDPAPAALLGKINQSLYLSAKTPEIQAILAKAPLDRLSPGIIDAVRARGAIYRGEQLLAKAAIRRFKTQYPDNPTVHLLDAELLSQSGDVKQARTILTSLIDDPKTPDWVHRVAEYLLNKANN